MKVLTTFLLAGTVLFAGPAIAQQSADTNMEILKQKLKADKRLLVADNMQLTDAEAKDFWPLYDEYQKELEQVNQKLGKTIMEYSDAYNKGQIPNDTAKKLLDQVLSIEEQEVSLKRTFAGKLERVLPATKTARYMQIETKIRSLLKLELAKQIPLVY
jgi:hypothetical protein